MLVTYLLTRDHRLARKSLLMLAEGQQVSGFLYSCNPDRRRQQIPPFSLWWIWMLEDYLLWNDDQDILPAMLPVAERIMEAFEACLDEEGLLVAPQGWIFYDWVQSYGKAFSFSGRQEQWTNGAPDVYSRQGTGVGSLLNWHYVGTLKIMERLEKAAGRLDEATGYAELALRISKRCIEKFYHATARLFADDETHSRYSVHSQLMAILSGTLDDTFSAQLYEAMKTTDIPLAQCTIYFSFYLFEVMKKYGDVVPFLDMLTYWQHLPDLGFSTTPERPEPSRSDCHAWGTHPYYDVMTFLGGISPCAYGGKEFAIRLPNRLPDGFSATIPLLVGDYKVCVRKGMVELTIPELGNFYYKEEKLAPGIVRIRQTF